MLANAFDEEGKMEWIILGLVAFFWGGKSNHSGGVRIQQRHPRKPLSEQEIQAIGEYFGFGGSVNDPPPTK